MDDNAHMSVTNLAETMDADIAMAGMVKTIDADACIKNAINTVKNTVALIGNMARNLRYQGQGAVISIRQNCSSLWM